MKEQEALKVSKLVFYLLLGLEITDPEGQVFKLDDQLNLCVKMISKDGHEVFVNTFYSLKPLLDLLKRVDLTISGMNSTRL